MAHSPLFRCVCSINVDSNFLCPSVKYPVPHGTPLISPLVKWDHTQTWDVPKAEDFPAGSGGSTSATVYNIGEREVEEIEQARESACNNS